jgi:MFS transporter, SP family, arabinose:H+ symporter
MGTSRVLLASAAIAAMGGFLFGFDTVVISGAEQKIQSLWQLSDTVHGLAMSAALWGTVLGALLGGWPTDRFGRKSTLLVIGLIYLVSAIWSALASDVYSFFVARFLGGLGVGVSTIVAPLYITEIAPAELRGRLTGMFQFNIVFGIVVAFLSNWLLRGTSDADWRWMMGVAAVPGLIYTLLCVTIAESPRWLISLRDNRQAGIDVLRKVMPELGPSQLESLADSIAHRIEEDGNQHHTSFWSMRMRKPILIAFLVAMFNQLSGINAVLYFAPRILGMTGLQADAAFIQTIGIGLINLVFTMLGLWFIDRLGRRTLLYIGSVGYILSLGTIAYLFIQNDAAFRVSASAIAARDAFDRWAQATADQPADKRSSHEERAMLALQTLNTNLADGGFSGNSSALPADSTAEQIAARTDEILEEASQQAGGSGRLVLFGILAFIAAHAIGQGTVIWVLISEVFPNEFRAAGQSLGCATHWIFAALLTLVFPFLVTQFSPGYVFAFFCFMMVLQLVWVATMVPETKGVPLEELQEQLCAP